MTQLVIVEDEGIVAKDIGNRLQKLGYTVLAIASSGEEAIKMVEEENPDLVLMDIVLKGDIDGIEAAKTIRTRFNIPVIYVTAHADDNTLQRAKVTEPYGYILKPFENRELHTVIEMALYKHKMENRVKESEQWLSTTLKSIGDAVITTDTHGLVTFMNPAAETVTGWTQKEAVGTSLDDILTLVTEETGERVENPAKKVLQKGVMEATDHNLLIRNGVKIHVDGSAAPIKDDKGTITGVVVVLRDITERTRVERVLKKTEEMYRARQRELAERKRREEHLRERQRQLDNLLTNVNAIVLEGDASEITLVAGQVQELLGYSREQWFSHPEGAAGFWEHCLHPEDCSKVVPYCAEAVREGRNYALEYRMIAADGQEVWFHDRSTVRIQEDGQVRVRSVLVDITERKKAEEELMELSTAVKMSSDCIVITDMEGNITDANEAALNMYRAQREDFIGKKVTDIVAPEDHKKVLVNTEEVLKKGYIENQEYNITAKDGTRITLETTITLIKTADGIPQGAVSISRDITERKKAEREMKKKLMRYNLEERNIYLAKEDTPCTSIEAFQDLLTVGYPGLAISRTPTQEFTDRFEQEFHYLWIAEKGDKHGIPPDVKEIQTTIEMLTKPTAVFIDRLDYLMSKTSFKEILFFVQRLREVCYLKTHVIILSVDPSTIDSRELRQIEKETAEIEPLYKMKLPEELFDILKVVYQQNTKGVNPSYTNVGQQIGASKPTTRKRVKVLISYGYLEESKKGRSKVLNLTEKGKTLFLK